MSGCVCFALLWILYSPSWKLLTWENGINAPQESQLTLCHTTQPDWSHVMVHLQLHITNNNNLFYSSQWEIKAVIQLHNKSLNNSKSLNTRTYTLLDIRSLSLNLHTLTANQKLNIYYYTNINYSPSRTVFMVPFYCHNCASQQLLTVCYSKHKVYIA